MKSSLKEHEIISDIVNGKEGVVVTLYNSYKEEFVNWSGFRYQLNKEDALDVFQDVVISFYENVKQGKLERLTHKLKTYLFAVGKNMIINRIKYDQRFDHQVDPVDKVLTYNTGAGNIEMTDRHRIIIDHLQQMGEPCHSILKLFFYHSFSMEAIAQNLNYKNADVVKSQKLRCIKELRKKVKSHYGQEDL